MRVCACILALGLTALAMPAQEVDFDQLAKDLSPGILRSRQTVPIGTYLSARVLVVDLRPEAQAPRGLGSWLADRLAEALVGTDYRFEIIDRNRVRAFLEEGDMTPRDLENPSVLRWICSELQANTLVVGSYRLDERVVHIRVSVERVSDSRVFAVARAELPRSPAVEDIIHQAADAQTAGEKDSTKPAVDDKAALAAFCGDVPRADAKGLVPPHCMSCPNPSWTEAARKGAGKEASFTVVTAIVVSSEGRITRTQTLRGAPFGLTYQAKQALNAWILEPARGPDGKPVEVCTTAETTFRKF